MKVTVQAKIAELESRIAILEKAQRVHSRITRETLSPPGQIWQHWDDLWKQFDKLSRAMFRRASHPEKQP